MPLLIIMNRDVVGTGRDSRTDKPEDWPKRGDVIEILPDGRRPGRKVTKEAGFHIIKVPGRIERYFPLTEAETEDVDIGNGEIDQKLWRFRLRKINEDLLAPERKEDLTRDGETELTRTDDADALVETKPLRQEETQIIGSR